MAEFIATVLYETQLFIPTFPRQSKKYDGTVDLIRSVCFDLHFLVRIQLFLLSGPYAEVIFSAFILIPILWRLLRAGIDRVGRMVRGGLCSEKRVSEWIVWC
jgi:hypothetical protein